MPSSPVSDLGFKNVSQCPIDHKFVNVVPSVCLDPLSTLMGAASLTSYSHAAVANCLAGHLKGTAIQCVLRF